MIENAQKVGQTETFEVTGGVSTRIGGMLETAHGVIDVRDVSVFSTLSVTHRTDPAQSRVGILLIDLETKKGMVAQVDAAAARTLAASFLRLADLLEPRVDH